VPACNILTSAIRPTGRNFELLPRIYAEQHDDELSRHVEVPYPECRTISGQHKIISKCGKVQIFVNGRKESGSN
jgi:hypothetical protein